jgi:pimeloyl-ACP methyl ester carboxylesterase
MAMTDGVNRRAILAAPGLLSLALLAPASARAQIEYPSAPPAPRGSQLRVEGGSLYYEAGGSGSRTVIFIHDGFTDSAVWEDIWPILGREYQVVRYDRRGHGRSPPATSAYSSLDDITALMRQLGLARATFVAGSDGAGLALEYAIANPGRVEQLVLASPLVTGAAVTDEMAMRRAAGGGAETWIADRYIVNGPNRRARGRLRAIYAASPHNLTFVDRQDRPRPPALPRLSAVRSPTLILSGSRDMPPVIAHSEAVQRAIPGAYRDPVQGSGHLIYIDESEIFAAAALAFIRPWMPR